MSAPAARRPLTVGKAGDGTAGEALDIEGLAGAVVLRRNPRSRRVTLRHDPATGTFSVSAPPRLPRAAIEDFLRRHAAWIRSRQAAIPPRLPFVHGARLPLLGRDVTLHHDPTAGRRPRLDDGVLRVGGPAAHMPARVEAHLRSLARVETAARAARMARAVDRRVAAVAVRDPRSRWGSCSAEGRLSFSWRLILSPEHVLDYVVAHEVAHLVEMNHSPRFWAVVDRLHPAPGPARAWLRAHGAALHRYG